MNDLLEYERGVTLEQLASLVGETSRRLVDRQKMSTLSTFLALTSLFDKGKPIKRYFQELDKGISMAEEAFSDIQSGGNASSNAMPSKGKISGVDKNRSHIGQRSSRREDTIHTIHELNKLGQIMGRKKLR